MAEVGGDDVDQRGVDERDAEDLGPARRAGPLVLLRRRRDAVALVAGVLAPLGIAAALVPLRASFAAPAAALVLEAVVVAVASSGTRVAGVVASASSSLWFDFFLTRPYERLAIAARPDIETAVSLFVVGVAVTELAARSRKSRALASEEADHVGLLYGLAELVATGAGVEMVVGQACRELAQVLALRSCRFDPRASERPVQRLGHDGHVELGRVRWSVHQLGLPGRQLELLVVHQGRVLGRFVLEPTPGHPVSLQRRLVAVAIADEVGAALAPALRSA